MHGRGCNPDTEREEEGNRRNERPELWVQEFALEPKVRDQESNAEDARVLVVLRRVSLCPGEEVQRDEDEESRNDAEEREDDEADERG